MSEPRESTQTRADLATAARCWASKSAEVNSLVSEVGNLEASLDFKRRELAQARVDEAELFEELVRQRQQAAHERQGAEG